MSPIDWLFIGGFVTAVVWALAAALVCICVVVVGTRGSDDTIRDPNL